MPTPDAKALKQLLDDTRRELKRHRRQMEVEFDALAEARANVKNLRSAITRFIEINERANANLAELDERLARIIRKAKRQK